MVWAKEQERANPARKAADLQDRTRYAYLNLAWESNLGYARDELKAMRFFDFVNPDDVGATQKATVTKMSRS